MIDVNGTTWKATVEYLNDRLATARAENDKNLSPHDTALLRGEIKALKGLLDLPALVQQKAQVFIDDPGYGTDSLDRD